ncbi:MAG: DUF4928 family protein [Phycisphaerales bacterium]
MTAIDQFTSWFHSLPEDTRYGGLPPKGVVAASLAVLERMREKQSTDFKDYVTSGKGQIAGATGAKLAMILARYAENRTFLSEGGRTNRGNHEYITSMLFAIEASGFAAMDSDSKIGFIDQAQEFVANKVKEYFMLERIKFEYSPLCTARDITSLILASAKKRSQHGAVAQHLVGAKLSLRFPEMELDLHPVSAQDKQLNRHGDFQVNDMVIHVTVAPNDGHYRKCAENVKQGLHTTLLVPDDLLEAARRLLRLHVPGLGATAESIESFIGQNLGEISKFSRDSLSHCMSQLLELYNENIRLVESDKSLQIEIPDAISRG